MFEHVHMCWVSGRNMFQVWGSGGSGLSLIRAETQHARVTNCLRLFLDLTQSPSFLIPSSFSSDTYAHRHAHAASCAVCSYQSFWTLINAQQCGSMAFAFSHLKEMLWPNKAIKIGQIYFLEVQFVHLLKPKPFEVLLSRFLDNLEWTASKTASVKRLSICRWKNESKMVGTMNELTLLAAAL